MGTNSTKITKKISNRGTIKGHWGFDGKALNREREIWVYKTHQGSTSHHAIGFSYKTIVEQDLSYEAFEELLSTTFLYILGPCRVRRFLDHERKYKVKGEIIDIDKDSPNLFTIAIVSPSEDSFEVIKVDKNQVIPLKRNRKICIIIWDFLVDKSEQCKYDLSVSLQIPNWGRKMFKAEIFHNNDEVFLEFSIDRDFKNWTKTRMFILKESLASVKLAAEKTFHEFGSYTLYKNNCQAFSNRLLEELHNGFTKPIEVEEESEFFETTPVEYATQSLPSRPIDAYPPY